MLLKLSFKLDWVHSCDILGLLKQQVTVLVEYKVEFSVFDEEMKMAFKCDLMLAEISLIFCQILFLVFLSGNQLDELSFDPRDA